MLLKVKDFEENTPIPIHNEYDANGLDLDFVDLHYLKKIELDGTVIVSHHTLLFKGKLGSQVEQICARCLKPVQKPLVKNFDLSYEVKQEDAVDTLDDLRDVLILDHPDQFLCSAQCKGICAGCGKDLNQEACTCVK